MSLSRNAYPWLDAFPWFVVWDRSQLYPGCACPISWLLHSSPAAPRTRTITRILNSHRDITITYSLFLSQLATLLSVQTSYIATTCTSSKTFTEMYNHKCHVLITLNWWAWLIKMGMVTNAHIYLDPPLRILIQVKSITTLREKEKVLKLST